MSTYILVDDALVEMEHEKAVFYAVYSLDGNRYYKKSEYASKEDLLNHLENTGLHDYRIEDILELHKEFIDYNKIVEEADKMGLNYA